MSRVVVIKIGILLVAALVALTGCDANEASPRSQPASPSTSASTLQEVSVPRCSEDIPFEPTYLPDGFGHEVFPGMFPGGRPPDDLASSGIGNPHEEQVIVHYRGSRRRAIEIRRPGTLFSELAQGDDAPTIEVLRGETTGFAPISPGGDDFIVQFRYPKASNSRGHDWCSLYSLNEYRVSLDELKRVAEGLRLRG